MRKINYFLAGLMMTGLLHADVLVLKNGQIVEGSYFGGTSGTVRIQTADTVVTYPVDEILALEFQGEAKVVASEPTVAPPPPPPPPPPAAPLPDEVTVPANTIVLVSLLQEVSTKNMKTGDPYKARLEAAIVVDGVVVAPIGTQVTGRVDHAQQAGRVRGSSELAISLTSLMTNGEMNAIATSNFADRGTPSAASAVKGAAAGAAIGGIADGSSGAGTGAAVGATLGALKKGDSIVIPRGRLLEFTMKAPAPVKVQQPK